MKQSLLFELPAARAAATTRHVAGAGRGDEAAEVLRRELGAPVARVEQVHGDRIVTAGAFAAAAGVTFLGTGDALVTERDDVTLAVVTADCVPVLLADARGRAVAAVHAGWRGVAARIVPKAVERLAVIAGVSPADLDVLIGPAAGGCCYEVGPEVVEAVRATLPGGLDESTWVRPGKGANPHADLRVAVRAQLEAAGLEPGAIRAVSDCTICGTDWPSWRREGNTAGRIWSGVRLRR